jgi:hypothetical protein
MFMNCNLEFSDREIKVPSLHRVKHEVRALFLVSCSFVYFLDAILLESFRFFQRYVHIFHATYHSSIQRQNILSTL